MRGIVSTHVAVSRQHLQKYGGGFAFCYNNCHDPAAIFDQLVHQTSA